MSPIALYYPWRHFQDEDWLKLAMLAWDKIVRVRPDGLPDNDQRIVRQLSAETDILIGAVPSEADLTTVADAFMAIIATHERDLVRHFRQEFPGGDERWAMAGSNRGTTAGHPLFDLYAGPHDPMISTELGDALVSLGLAITGRTGSRGQHHWISVRRRLGSAYLAALADVMARRNGLAPVTDTNRMHRAFGALDQIPEMLFRDDGPQSGLEDADSAYLHVALNAVLEPQRLADVPVATLVKFRERYRAELVAFRQHITALSGELQVIAAVENPEIARAHLESLYERVTKPQLDELRGALRGLGIESTIGAMALKIDVGAAASTVLGAAAAEGGHWAVAGAAAVIAVIPYVASIRKRSRERTTSPTAVLLAADRKLRGEALLRSAYPAINGDSLSLE